MNGAIIGFGTIAQGHMNAYQSINNVNISGIVDCNEERRHLAKQLHPSIRVYNTIEELLQEQNFDFIDICSPPDSHFQYIKKALIAHCHVMCEKPFLVDLDQYIDIISLIRQTGRNVYPSHNYKFAPVLKWVKEQVKSVTFGKIKQGHFRTLRSGHAIGVKEWTPHWRRIPEISSGGIIRDHGTHSIYLACYFLDQYPISVSCISGNLNSNDGYTSTEDTAILTLYFENNVQFLIDLSWASYCRSTYYSVIGDCQNIIIDNDNIWVNTDGIFVNKQIESEFDDPTHKSWFYDMFNDFLKLIENQEKQIPILQEAFITTTVINKAYESAANQGRVIQLTNDLWFQTTKGNNFFQT